MKKTDLRTLNWDHRKVLRQKSLQRYATCHNVSFTAREMGINRQVLHRWIQEEKKGNSIAKRKKGRPAQKLYKTQVNQLLNLLMTNRPCDLNMDTRFWSLHFVKEVLSKHFYIDISPYLIRNYLHQWGFPHGWEKTNFNFSSSDTENLPLHEFARRHNMFCYYAKESVCSGYRFLCILSTRGDLRFIGSNIMKEQGIYSFIKMLYYTTKKKIIIICNKNILDISCKEVKNISQKIKLFDISNCNLV